MKRNDQTVTFSIAALNDFTPSTSAGHTAAIATVAAPWSGEGDDPATSYTPGMTETGRILRHARDTIRLQHTLIIAASVALIIALAVALTVIPAAANQRYWQARTAASYTGWVSIGGGAPPVALTIEPCRHSPCANIAIDLTIASSLGTREPPCTLGGVLTNNGYGFDVYQVCPGGVPVRATYSGSAPIMGSTTDGTGTLYLTYGSAYFEYHLQSATTGEQNAIFGGH